MISTAGTAPSTNPKRQLLIPIPASKGMDSAISRSATMKAPAATAIKVPKTLVAWKIASDQARARVGNISATSALATAHSPPTPMATRKRNIAMCHQVSDRAETNVNAEYMAIV